MKIVLVGGPASGKTTIGKQLATQWQLSFEDTDHWIEAQCGKTVAEIFKEEGEAYFREWETKALRVLLSKENIVIATGGGIVKKPENRALLTQGSAIVIYLNVSVTTQLKRTYQDQTRPLLQVEDKAAVLQQLSEERGPLYCSVADCVVDANLSAQCINDRLIVLTWFIGTKKRIGLSSKADKWFD